MSPEEIDEILNDWYQQGRHKLIVDDINKWPKTKWNYSVRIHLARAYNNISEFDKALDILMSQEAKNEDDVYWNYLVGYTYFHKLHYDLALKFFEKSYSLGRTEVIKYIDWCKKHIKNNSIEIKILANKYKAFGFNVSCITDKPNLYNSNSRSYFKTPSHSWTNLFNSKQTLLDYEDYDWQNSVGIGTFTKWNNLVVIDIDGCQDISFLKKILNKLGLPEDYEWVVESGSKNGFHIYYSGNKIDECDDDDVVSAFPPKQEFEKYLDKIEFLWKTHTVLPPSVHGSGNRYSFLNGSFPTKAPVKINTETIYNFIETFLEFKEIQVGSGYGEIMTLISSKTEIITDFKEEDITKHLLDDVYLIIDIETSGLPKKTNSDIIYPEILQIAWVLSNKIGIVLKKNSFIIDTPYIINNNYSEFVNIDFKTARKVKFPINLALKKLAEDIKICDYVVAHNIEFDLEILGHYFSKSYGLNPFKNKNKICTMKSSINFCAIPNNYGYKYPKLSELYFKLYNYQVKNSHNAEIDVLHTLKCFKKLKSLGQI